MREMSFPEKPILPVEVMGSILRSGVIGIGGGIVLGALGPFGTFERLPFSERMGFWWPAPVQVRCCTFQPTGWRAGSLSTSPGRSGHWLWRQP
jgi:hypothetical protein